MKFYGGGAYFGSNPSEAIYYDGTNATSSFVPYTYDIALDGRPYLVDLSQPFYRQQRRQLEPLIRTQADTSNEPGEQSMDPNGLWRRSYENWTLGAGQRYLDRATSQDNAYWQSFGLDTLTTAWQVSLLPEMDLQGASGQTLPTDCIQFTDSYMYFLDTAGLYYVSLSDITPGGSLAWNSVTGLASVPTSIASDGTYLWCACGTNGIYQVTNTAATQYVSASIGTTNLIGYENGRLLLWSTVGSTNSVYNITAGGASLPTALTTFDNPGTVVTCFASGNSWIYVGANVGTQGTIWGTQVDSAATALNPLSVQTNLPTGETCDNLLGYLGYLLSGSNQGIRLNSQGTTGVTLGALIPLDNGARVLSSAAFGSFIYFDWSNYNSSYTGIGKVSLENFTIASILPAYASDRMISGQGSVVGIADYNGTLLVAVSGNGIYMDDGNLMSEGYVDSGYILYDLTDPKVPALLDVQGASVQEYGSYTAYLSTDAGAFETVGSAQPGALITNTFQLQQGSGSRFEVRLQLNRDATTTSQGPVITRWTLRSYPAPLRPKTWQLPIVLDEEVVNESGMQAGFDPEVEINALEAMANNGVPVIYQEGNEQYLVFVTDVQFIARSRTSDLHFFNGLALVNVQSIPVPTSQYL